MGDDRVCWLLMSVGVVALWTLVIMRFVLGFG